MEERRSRPRASALPLFHSSTPPLLPALCVRCGTPFGVKSTIDRIATKLEGRHWMYPAGDRRLEVLRMCADCRVIVMSEQQFDPFQDVPERAPPRTTDDYLRQRQNKE